MAARVQIVIEAKDASSGVLRGITSQLGSLGGVIEELTTKNINWGSLAQTAATLVVDGLKDSIAATQEYAQEVRDLALASGASAEQASRMLQVLDDYQLTAQDAATATKALTREGLAPTIETIAEVSREYLSLTDAQEKNELVQKKLGRASKEWLNLLSQGPDAIMAMNSAVSAGLILNQQQLDDMENMRLAQDAWNDSILEVKLAVGSAVGELVVYNQRLEQAREMYMQMHPEIVNVAQATAYHQQEIVKLAQGLEDNAQRAKYYSETIAEIPPVLEEMNVNYQNLIGSIQNFQSEIDRYNDKNIEIHDTEQALMEERAGLVAQLETLRTQGYSPLGKTMLGVTDNLAEVDEKLAENKKQLDENAEAHKRWAAQTVFAFAQARAAADGNITEGEGQILIDMGVQLGLFDEQTAIAMENVNKAFDNVDTENAQDVIQALEDSLIALTGEDWVINITTDTSGVSTSNANNPNVNYQTGGQVYAGNAYTVGEAGAEPFFPSTNGRILGHAESLHALSLGGGGTNYFYGNVTLQIGADEGAGLMSIR